MMLNKFLISSSWKAFPLITSQRFRVRHLPKEFYNDFECPLYEGKKPGKTWVTELFAVANRKDLFWAFFKERRKLKKIEEMHEDQQFLVERHTILGPNLATAHFLCAREGKVKFKNLNTWTTKDTLHKIPDKYVDGYFIEEIDASGTNLCYEGFENLCNLTELRKLILRNCPFVDDWCLSRSYIFGRSLQYLDISGCKNVTERGICALHPLRELKTLVLHDTPNLRNKELVSLLLQDVIPNLEVIGLDFNDPEILKEIDKLTS